MIRYLSKRVMLLIAGLVFMIPVLGKPLMAKIDGKVSKPWKRPGAVKRQPNFFSADADADPCVLAPDSSAGE